ncbi:hypothetical protein EXN65_14275 [Clostridium botulinum]|uniref:hypothetical protein n=1 Tax=Clostridium botulinum TaxID=1491 RepID=UPI00016BB5D9|nr:hypothetical protein [Clostridium botulinum]EDT84161.1 hypothetical protein CBB_A0184 [Clostridium botulinum Bf]MBY6881620.1 hypothetical protein [Clostridium botulinum]NEZ86248.1 hypothetical protein [Clostridium botulinum]NFB01099.1 hypothetical protein [Clostridium botulinum]NFE18588.1 hypothetical protein [Clostridium botulinum]
MITNNDKRSDKFYPMNHELFNKCVAFALRNGDRKVSYCKIKDGVLYGGMADSLEDALEWCKVFYKEDNSFDLSIGDFREEGSTWSTKDILHEIGAISDEEYNKYIDNLKTD